MSEMEKGRIWAIARGSIGDGERVMDQLAVLEFQALSPPSPSCCSSVSRQHSSAGARAQCTPVADPKYSKYNDQSIVCTEFKCNIQAAGAVFGSAQLVAATKTKRKANRIPICADSHVVGAEFAHAATRVASAAEHEPSVGHGRMGVRVAASKPQCPSHNVRVTT